MIMNKDQLKQLAELAAAQGFEWIAQDGINGVWYGYKIKPKYRKRTEEWVTDSPNDIAPLKLPDDTDYSKRIFEISKLLNNEL